MDKEQRILTQSALTVETRAEGDQKRRYITGCAVKFNVRSELLGWFYEIIDERAFDECDMADVVGLINHDNNLILGRTLAGTLTLEVRAGDGVYFNIPVDEQDPDHVRYARKIEKGEIRGCSFQFSIPQEATKWDIDPSTGVDLRRIMRIARLYDVGPVTFPAYSQTDTTISKRSLDIVKAEYDHMKEERSHQAAPPAPPTLENQPETPPTPTQDRLPVAPLSVYKRKLQLLTTVD